MSEKEQAPPGPKQRSTAEQYAPEEGRRSGVNGSQARRKQVEAEGKQAEADDQSHGGPAEEDGRGGVVITQIWQWLSVPLVPLVPETAVDIDVNQLGARTISHKGRR